MKRVLFFFFVCGSALLFGQADVSKIVKDMKVRSIGPAGMSGRVTSIDAISGNPKVIYAGTASGGIWKSTDGGIKWDPVFDKAPLQSIGAVAIDPGNSDIVWAGTGEGNPRNSHNSGAGIFKSLNAGKDWNRMGLIETHNIHRVIVNPKNSNEIYVAALGSAWGPHPERGVFKSTDGGQSWEKILYVNDSTGCADLVMDPSNPLKLIAAMWEFERKPWTFRSGGNGSGMYMTLDGGKTWKELGPENGLPEKPLGRMGLAIAPSDPSRVYALVESKDIALYASEDGGYHFEKRATQNVGNRPFYYADIYVDPKNENRIYSLWSIVTKSEDGGRSFETLLSYGDIHPDHHALWIDPANPDLLINGNDGGLTISRDRGKSWQFVQNLPVGQFYHIDYDMETPYNVYGGLQDNGSWVGPSAVWQRGGIRNHYWQELLFGDGFDVLPMPGNSRYGYAMSQGGSLHRYDKETGKLNYIQPVHPDGIPLRFNWNAALAADPFNDRGLYFGSQFLHYSPDGGSSWQILSPDLTTNDSSKQQQAKSGGLTIDATKAENFTTITTIAPDLFNKNVIAVGTDDGNLQITRDGGQHWENVSDRLPGLPRGSWIQQVVASPFHEGSLFVVANNYRRNDWKPYAYRSSDFGQSWERIADEYGVKGHCWSIVPDWKSENLLFLGTEYGLYYSLNGGRKWQKWDHKIPSAPVRDLKIHPREHDLIVATFGRSVYLIDDIRALRRMAEDAAFYKRAFAFPFTAPGYLVSYKSYPAPRFAADESFSGENDTRNAIFGLWVEKTGKEARQDYNSNSDSLDSSIKWDKISILILDENGDTIRRFHHSADTGFQQVEWGMSRNGFRFPSRKKPKADDDLPPGMQVAPGIYRVYAHFGPWADSNSVEILPDPRTPFDSEAYEAQLQLYSELGKIVNEARLVFEGLRSMKESVLRVNSSIELLPDSTKEALRDRGKEILDSVKTLMALYMTPDDFTGYDHVSIRLNNLLYSAARYVQSAEGKPGENARNAVRIAEKKTKEAARRYQNLRNTAWKDYAQTIEQIKIPLIAPPPEEGK